MCYIGSTTKEHLAQIMAEHRNKFRHWQKTGNGCNYTAFRIFEKYGVENCRIILVILYQCNRRLRAALPCLFRPLHHRKKLTKKASISDF